MGRESGEGRAERGWLGGGGGGGRGLIRHDWARFACGGRGESGERRGDRGWLGR